MASQLSTSQTEDEDIEAIASEEADRESEKPGYEIITYPADFTLEGLHHKFISPSASIEIPGFQRKFVWTIKQSSRLIESFLLGLPVPAIFLYTDPKTGKLQVIDGQQRLLSVVQFFSGYFGPETKGKRTIFRLTGLSEKSPYFEKTFEALRESDESAFNQLNNAVLRAFVIKQTNPKDSTSIYHIFERLNTGGTQLVGQEIRNCVYHGPLNDLLCELNRFISWRKLYGKPEEDKRQRDVELILRFMALREELHRYEKPMKDFLSTFMSEHRSGNEKMSDWATLFSRTCDVILDKLGAKPFHIRAGLNAAVFDSVFVSISKHLENIPDDLKSRYKELIKDNEFLTYVSSSTTDGYVVPQRIKIAEKYLFSK